MDNKTIHDLAVAYAQTKLLGVRKLTGKDEAI